MTFKLLIKCSLAILRTTYVTELNSPRTVLVRTVTQRCEIYAACDAALICLLQKFHKILLFTMKVIHKKLRGSANYGPPCIRGAVMSLISTLSVAAMMCSKFICIVIGK